MTFVQIAAAIGALRTTGMVILEDHLKGCVRDAIRGDQKTEPVIDEVIDLIKKFSK